MLCGSLRRDSYNRALLECSRLAQQHVSIATFEGLGAFPLYDGDVEDAGDSATVVALRHDRRRGRAADRDPRVQRRHERRPQERPRLGLPGLCGSWRVSPSESWARQPAGWRQGGIESVVKILGSHPRPRARPRCCRSEGDSPSTRPALHDPDIRADVAELVTELVVPAEPPLSSPPDEVAGRAGAPLCPRPRNLRYGRGASLIPASPPSTRSPGRR